MPQRAEDRGLEVVDVEGGGLRDVADELLAGPFGGEIASDEVGQ